MLRLAISLCLLSVVTAVLVNDWDMPFQFTCGVDQFLWHIRSVHNNKKEDRRWELDCSELPLGNAQDCYWTGYVNEFDGDVDFHCQGNEFIAGMASEHNDHHEDRRFKFYCCDAEGALLHSCYHTGWVNDWDGVLDFYVPSKKVLKGTRSKHDNHKEDRRYKFQVCEMARSS